eukprot:gnl/TRDRNA2_/TRDRNA2_74164_c0_seq1.p1 gnl/TRDRNA2_/TRDRNA2_74164_c0~~gnl/TRDRNA2_/TRDRNA2_74164_c0_seq1.p1  ORF type:complete len:270 (+),score=29.24 gnl/TRDRNA2_/TRDRNA2_74164_c0_seq1:54-863(+)
MICSAACARAKDHAAFETCRWLKSTMLRSASRASIVSRGRCNPPAWANAQAVLVISWDFKSPTRCAVARAKAAKRTAFDCSVIASAHAAFARCCALKLPICRSVRLTSAAQSEASDDVIVARHHARLVKIYVLQSGSCFATHAVATESGACDLAAVAKDHSVFAKLCTAKSCMCLSAAVARISGIQAVIENDHTVLARFRGLKSPTCHLADDASDTKRSTSGSLAVEKAHAVIVSSSVLKVCLRHSAARATAVNSGGTGRDTVANAHAM